MPRRRLALRSGIPQRVLTTLALAFGALTLLLLPASAASADVNDFSYSSWDARYDVSLDAEGRAVAHVTETLVAEFPDHDQNKGIVRGYPERYQGAGVALQIVSVKDAAGADVPYETESDDGVLYVLTGTDDYVHGTNTYVIDYTMRDFMVTGEKSGNDEFYWDLLPLDSTQRIGSFRADVRFSADLAATLTGDTACYQGRQGSTDACVIEGPHADGDARIFSVSSTERAAGDGVTVAIGFTAGTVTQPAARRPDGVADFGPALVGLLGIVASFATRIAVRAHARRRRRATGIVVAQFDVPDELLPLTAAALLPGRSQPVPAQIVRLAVGGALRLEDSADARGDTDRPQLRLLDRSAAAERLDIAMLDALFPAEKTLRRIPRTSEKFAKRMQKLERAGVSEARTRGWTTKERSRAGLALAWASAALLVATGALTLWTAMLDRELLPLSIIALIVTLIITPGGMKAGFSRHTVLTRSGAERYEYLLGVKEFIRVAEADRMRMLQSYQGADRRSDGTVDVIHLYEKLLPYAMLFDQEKSWSTALEARYVEHGRGPTWMDTAAGVSLGSNLSRYSGSMQNAASYTAPSAGSSSSGGGSTGGGFSGGGGGGGFSGGR